MASNGTKEQTQAVMPPSKLAHVVLRTNQMEEMIRFYTQFLGGKLVHKAEALAFIAYDDEHHRIAFIQIPGTRNKDYDTCGLEHIAFTFDTVKDLCTAYKQRKALGIEPGWCVNHGPTTSMYYRDPDGNQLETQVDNYDDVDEATAMMTGPLFGENSLGVDYDPEELCAAVERGEDEAKLKEYKGTGPRGPEDIPKIFESIRAAPVGA